MQLHRDNLNMHIAHVISFVVQHRCILIWLTDIPEVFRNAKVQQIFSYKYEMIESQHLKTFILTNKYVHSSDSQYCANTVGVIYNQFNIKIQSMPKPFRGAPNCNVILK